MRNERGEGKTWLTRKRTGDREVCIKIIRTRRIEGKTQWTEGKRRAKDKEEDQLRLLYKLLYCYIK